MQLLYARRSKINPLWNSLLVGGCSPEGKRFLAYVDLLGTTYSASTLATGYGAYIAQPLLRKAVEGREDTLTEAEAVKILEDSLKVLYYRDARSLNKVRLRFRHPFYPFHHSTLSLHPWALADDACSTKLQR